MSDVCDIELEELMEDVGLKKGHARRLVRHFA
jgi:hypothetical protein